MEISLYGNKIKITEANVCEARGKYLAKDALKKNVYLMLRHELLKCSSFKEMILKAADITSGLILGLTRHFLYVLRREGVESNGKNFLDSVFKQDKSACFAVSQALLSDYKKLELKNANDIKGAAVWLANAAIMDLEGLWRGYSSAHRFSSQAEVYTVKKYHDAKSAVDKLSANAEKNLQKKMLVQALRDAPFDMSVYEKTRNLLGDDEGHLVTQLP